MTLRRFREEINLLSTDLELADSISRRIIESCSVSELTDGCDRDIHVLAMEENGFVFLKNLLRKLAELEMPDEIEALFQEMIRDSKTLKSLLFLYKPGCKTILEFLKFCPRMKDSLLTVLQSIFLGVFTNRDEPETFFELLFSAHFSTEQLKPVALKAASSVFSITAYEYGYQNFTFMVENSTPGFIHELFSVLPDTFFLNFAYEREGNKLLQTIIEALDQDDRSLLLQRISSNFPHFSRHRFANYIVRSFIEFSDKDGVLFIGSQLSPFYPVLVTHVFGNHVVQKIIWRFGRDGYPLPQFLLDQIRGRRAELLAHPHGRSVIIQYQDFS